MAKLIHVYPACRATFTLPSWKRGKRKRREWRGLQAGESMSSYSISLPTEYSTMSTAYLASSERKTHWITLDVRGNTGSTIISCTTTQPTLKCITYLPNQKKKMKRKKKDAALNTYRGIMKLVISEFRNLLQLSLNLESLRHRMHRTNSLRKNWGRNVLHGDASEKGAIYPAFSSKTRRNIFSQISSVINDLCSEHK